MTVGETQKSRGWLVWARLALVGSMMLVMLVGSPRVGQTQEPQAGIDAMAPGGVEEVPVGSSAPELSVAQTSLSLKTKAAPTRTLPGESVIYTVVLSNNGDDAGTVDEVSDTLDPHLSFHGMSDASDVSTPPQEVTNKLAGEGPFEVPGQGELSLTYEVRTTAETPFAHQCNRVEARSEGAFHGPEEACITLGTEWVVFVPTLKRFWTPVPAAPPAPEVWDPRGMIAFERQATDSEFHDIYLMFNDGSRLENLTSFAADDGAPTWSPDGNFIAFSSNRVGHDSQAIFKIDLRSRQVSQLTSGEFKDRWPTWSPDGTRIAFMRRLFTNGHANGEIFVMNADGTDQRNITNYEWGDDYPAWSRDGEWIAFTSERNWGGRDLWLVRPNGSDARIVRRTDFQAELYPTWSPDGQIYHTFSPNQGDGFLFRVRPDGGGATQVFDDSFKRYIASFAPDGQCFVFYSYMGGPDKEIWKWCNGYDTPRNLTNNEGISDEFCAWSPVP